MYILPTLKLKYSKLTLKLIYFQFETEKNTNAYTLQNFSTSTASYLKRRILVKNRFFRHLNLKINLIINIVCNTNKHHEKERANRVQFHPGY